MPIRSLLPLRYCCLLALLTVLSLTGWSPSPAPAASAADESTSDDAAGEAAGDDKDAADASAAGWRPLFNGKDLEGWKITNFGGEGEAFVEDGEVVISQGAYLSGIHTERKLAGPQYEVRFEAQRQAGSDFFVGLTFPVSDSHCSLILGGWGGGVCGLSSLEGMDASENETTTYIDFEKGRWYQVRVVVTDSRIDAWVDDVHVVDVETEGRRIGVRFEVERSKPFGFATFQTTGRIRNARIRDLPVPDDKPAKSDKPAKGDKPARGDTDGKGVRTDGNTSSKP